MHKIRYYNLFAALLQVVVAFISAMSGFGERSTEISISSYLAFSAPYIYSIWWVIFALSIAYAIYMLCAKEEKAKKFVADGDELCRYTTAAFLLNSAWMLVAKYCQPHFVWPTLIIICLTYICLFTAMRLVTEKPFRRLSLSYRYKVVPICLWAGWTSLALFINIGAIVDAHNLALLGLSTLQASTALLIGATILAGFALYYSNAEPSYAIALIWGFVGIYIGNFADTESRLISDTAVGMVLILLVLCFWFKRSEKA